MSPALPVNGFKWIEHTSKFDKNFTNQYNKSINKAYFVEVDIEYPKQSPKISIYLLHFFWRKLKYNYLKNLYEIFTIEKNMLHLYKR